MFNNLITALYWVYVGLTLSTYESSDSWYDWRTRVNYAESLVRKYARGMSYKQMCDVFDKSNAMALRGRITARAFSLETAEKEYVYWMSKIS